MGQSLSSFRGSLRLEFLAIYSLLALTTIVFFSTVILENQSDLLLDLFRYQSRDVTRDLGRSLRGVFDAAHPEALQSVLAREEVTNYTVLNAEGKCLLPVSCTAPPGADARVRTLISEAALFKTDSHIAVDADSGKTSFVIPLDERQTYFLFGELKVSSMEARMAEVTRQLWIVLGWMIAINAFFGVYAYRRIFRRVGSLKDASARMTAGELSSRVSWKFRNDELDVLGKSFNEMAERIEAQVGEISRLNQEMSDELDVGREVQQIFLPEKETVAAMGIALHFRPMRAVSGDVYYVDSITTRSGTYDVIFLADATGHGVPAALITSILLLSLREVLATTIHPARALARLSDLMCERLQSQYYATGCIFIRDSAGRIHFASGGHPACFWYRPATGQIRELESTGPMLGLIEGADFEASTVRVQKGDRFLLYTDGVTEGKRGHEMFGHDPLKAILQTSSSPEELVREVWMRLDGFVDEHVDDVTILAFEV